jgi:hypothetical protein
MWYKQKHGYGVCPAGRIGPSVVGEDREDGEERKHEVGFGEACHTMISHGPCQWTLSWGTTESF